MEKEIKKNRDQKLFRRKLESKRKRRVRRKNVSKLDALHRLSYNSLNVKHANYAKVRAPETLSLVLEPELTIKFINRVKEHYLNKKKVFVNFKYVEKVGYDALVVLLQILVQFKVSKIGFNGNYPDDSVSRDLIISSGFFDYLYSNIKDEDRYEFIKGGAISTHAWKKVDAELTHEIIGDATKFIWGEKRRLQGVQKSLIELMHNTNNHAAIGREGEKHWFLSVEHRKEEKKVSFSFIDFGVGIFENLENKPRNSKWYNWKNQLMKLFAFNNNKELLKLILNGELHRTVTGKYYRGKGLPGIYNAFKRNQMSNLHIISNNVFADMHNTNFKDLSNSFSGTFVYWEVTENTINIHGID